MREVWGWRLLALAFAAALAALLVVWATGGWVEAPAPQPVPTPVTLQRYEDPAGFVCWWTPYAVACAPYWGGIVPPYLRPFQDSQ